MTIKDMETSRIELLQGILTRIKAWDSDPEEAIMLIEKNEFDIKKIQEYNIEISKEASKLQLEEDYNDKIAELELEMKKFLKNMKNKKQILLEEKKQFGKNNEIITNYITSDFKAAFIDKNV